ncbi:multiprotein-bridging factor 1 family protein [Saccharothrix sp.]|uniref:helix-turn-helix domain-containing protein n=1 Tax=Saccharothrix sp. TaxID=1873460 RepID=UPI0035C792B6
MRPATCQRAGGVRRRLRDSRTAAGLTQAGLGNLLGYHHSLISKVEAGTRRPPPDLAARCVDLLHDRELLALWSAVEDERRAEGRDARGSRGCGGGLPGFAAGGAGARRERGRGVVPARVGAG